MKISAAGQCKPDQQADIDGDAFAAFEFEPDRKQMAEKSAEAGDERGIGSGEMRREQNRGGALERVAQQGRGGQTLAAGAQHIGGADIAGADGADVGRAGGARQDQPERNRAEQIADREGDQRRSYVFVDGAAGDDGAHHAAGQAGFIERRVLAFRFELRPDRAPRACRYRPR